MHLGLAGQGNDLIRLQKLFHLQHIGVGQRIGDLRRDSPCNGGAAGQGDQGDGDIFGVAQRVIGQRSDFPHIGLLNAFAQRLQISPADAVLLPLLLAVGIVDLPLPVVIVIDMIQFFLHQAL